MIKTERKEKPILFKGPLVRAIFEGRKTETRRVFALEVDYEPDNKHCCVYLVRDPKTASWNQYGTKAELIKSHSTYQIGDTLWVRETWAEADDGGATWYRAGVPRWVAGRFTGEWLNFPYKTPYSTEPDPKQKWKPSIFMPRHACRLRLEVIDVDFQRLHQMKAVDCVNEGIEIGHRSIDTPCGEIEAFNSFIRLWDGINKKRGYGFGSNPWVFVYKFKVKQEEEVEAA